MGRVGWRVGALSLVLIASQIVIMQALAIGQWSHFAYMIIAIALLGFGVSGTLLSLFPQWIRKRADWIAFAATQLCAYSLMLALPLTMSDALRFDMMKLFMEEGHTLRLIASYLCYFLPFFWGAVAIGLTFVIYPERSGILYGWNLAGSALGGPVAILLLSITLSNRAAMLLALIVACMGLVQATTRSRFYCAVPAVLLGAALACFPPNIHLSEYKDLARTLNLPEVRVENPIPSPMGEVRTAIAPSLRYAPGLSLSFTGQPPVGEAIFVNANRYGTLLPAISTENDYASHILDYTLRGAPYALRQPNRALILDAGAGENVSHALSRNVDQIDTVEPHPIVRTIAKSHIEQTRPQENTSDLQWWGTTPRTWLESRKDQHLKYDLVVLPEMGQFGGDAGVRATEENYLLTRQAFQSLQKVLSDNGILTATVWLDYPPRDPLRLAALFIDLLEKNEIGPAEEHLMVLRNWGMVTFLLSKSAWTEEEIQQIDQFTNQHGFDRLVPVASESTTPAFHTFEDDTLGEMLIKMVQGDPQGKAADYIFDLSVPTDNKPFFRHYLKWSELDTYQDLFMDSAAPFLEVGFPILLLTFLQIALISLPLIFLPVLKMRKLSHDFLRTFFYFGGVGCGFMLWQIALIQKYTLYWGHPLYATAGVISILLLGMGAGSLWSGSLKNHRKRSIQTTAAIALLLLFYSFFLMSFLTGSLGWSIGWKILLGTVLLLPPAFLMGIPFPLGIRLVSDASRVRIGWAWGLDGYASVISASGAALLSLQYGLQVPVLLAASGYAIASMAMGFPRLAHKNLGR